jgi:hypothetical protein
MGSPHRGRSGPSGPCLYDEPRNIGVRNPATRISDCNFESRENGDLLSRERTEKDYGQTHAPKKKRMKRVPSAWKAARN